MAWWTNLFRKEPELDIVSNAVPLSTITRWYIYDTNLLAPEAVNDFAEMLGLSRVSSEGHDMEMLESEARLKHLAPLMPFLDYISDISSQLFTAIHLNELLDDDPDADDLDEQANEMKNVYKAVAFSTLIGALASGINIGLIEHNTMNSELSEVEVTDE